MTAEYGLRGGKRGGAVTYFCKSHGPSKGCFKINKDRVGERTHTHTSFVCSLPHLDLNRSGLCMATSPLQVRILPFLVCSMGSGAREDAEGCRFCLSPMEAPSEVGKVMDRDSR